MSPTYLLELAMADGTGPLGRVDIVEPRGGNRVLSQILLEFECGHRPDIIMLRAPQTAEMQ